MPEIKYTTFHIEYPAERIVGEEGGDGFEAYKTVTDNGSETITQIYDGADYGAMIDAVLADAGIEVHFEHSVEGEDEGEDENMEIVQKFRSAFVVE